MISQYDYLIVTLINSFPIPYLSLMGFLHPYMIKYQLLRVCGPGLSM